MPLDLRADRIAIPRRSTVYEAHGDLDHGTGIGVIGVDVGYRVRSETELAPSTARPP
jgi:hypothetical protein